MMDTVLIVGNDFVASLLLLVVHFYIERLLQLRSFSVENVHHLYDIRF